MVGSLAAVRKKRPRMGQHGRNWKSLFRDSVGNIVHKWRIRPSALHRSRRPSMMSLCVSCGFSGKTWNGSQFHSVSQSASQPATDIVFVSNIPPECHHAAQPFWPWPVPDRPRDSRGRRAICLPKCRLRAKTHTKEPRGVCVTCIDPTPPGSRVSTERKRTEGQSLVAPAARCACKEISSREYPWRCPLSAPIRCNKRLAWRSLGPALAQSWRGDPSQPRA